MSTSPDGGAYLPTPVDIVALVALVYLVSKVGSKLKALATPTPKGRAKKQ